MDDLPAGLLVEGLTDAEIVALVEQMPAGDVAAILATVAPEDDSTVVTQPLDYQQPPDGRWRGWVLMGGRGSGKTWAGTAWLAGQAATRPGLRARVIAPTSTDAVVSCVYGESGMLAHDPTARFAPSQPGGAAVVWPNGSQVWVLGTPTVRDVDRLRALTNIDIDLFEEAAANPQLAAAVDQARMSRRRAGARWAATTTPRPWATIKEWDVDPEVVVTRAVSHDNPHADREWLADIDARWAGTRLYRQEILGEIVDEVEGARWQYAWLDRSRVAQVPDGCRWAVGVDPASGSGTTGIVAVAVDPDGHLYVTDDGSTSGDPAVWARQVATLAAMRDATVIAEDDQGGRMVKAVLAAAGVTVPVKPAHARRVGPKQARADAVAVLWEKDPPEAHMVSTLPRLEDQMVSWIPGEGSSPDRLDAMVWAAIWLRHSAHRPVAATVPDGTFAGW